MRPKHVTLLLSGALLVAALTPAIAGGPFPDYDWGYAVGGASYDYGFNVAVDSHDNIFLTGCFRETVDFHPDGGDQRTSTGGYHSYVTKFNADGTYAWTVTWGGTGGGYPSDFNCIPYDIAIDGNDELIIVGKFKWDCDFDPGPDELILHGRNYDFYTLKLDADGNFLWVNTVGGTSNWDYAYAVAIDSVNSVYITGMYMNSNDGPIDFDPGEGEDLHDGSYTRDIYISKYYSDGSYAWTAWYDDCDGCQGREDSGYGIDVDPFDNIVVTGVFAQTIDFDPGEGVDNRNSANGSADMYVTKLGPDGSYHWTRTIGEIFGDAGRDIVTDADGNIYVTGYWSYGGFAAMDFDPTGGFDFREPFTYSGAPESFLTKFGPDGSYDWTRIWGEQWDEQPYRLALDPNGNPVIVGKMDYFCEFDPIDMGNPGDPQGDYVECGYANRDVYVTKAYADGSYAWTFHMGGPPFDYDDHGYGITVNAANAIIYCGATEAGTFDLDHTEGEDVRSNHGERDIFMCKLVGNLPGDLNGDGCVDQADLGILLADWGCTGGDCPGDGDGDGETGQTDLGILLANWDAGCP